MALIHLETLIQAPVERVFDLSRSIELHLHSTRMTHERAVAGKTSGLIGLNETVTWRARHFGVYQHLTVRITAFERPYMFADTMVKGAFASMHHIHRFRSVAGGTSMTDDFSFTAPFGILGRLAEMVVLRSYLTRFLRLRNSEIQTLAEGEGWRELLSAQ